MFSNIQLYFYTLWNEFEVPGLQVTSWGREQQN